MTNLRQYVTESDAIMGQTKLIGAIKSIFENDTVATNKETNYNRKKVVFVLTDGEVDKSYAIILFLTKKKKVTKLYPMFRKI